jgi:hypothetical protein
VPAKQGPSRTILDARRASEACPVAPAMRVSRRLCESPCSAGLYARQASVARAAFFRALVATRLMDVPVILPVRAVGRGFKHPRSDRSAGLQPGRRASLAAEASSRSVDCQPLHRHTAFPGTVNGAPISSPLIRFFPAPLACSTRDGVSSRIARKSLKTLTRAPFYPRRISSHDVTQKDLPREPALAPSAQMGFSPGIYGFAAQECLCCA